MVKEVSCGAVVFKVEDGIKYYLVVEHLKGGHIGFPKGHVENNESYMHTAMREVLEETGIDIDIVSKKMATNTYLMPNGIYKDVYYFLAEAKNFKIKVQASELRDAYWFNRDDLLRYLTYDNDKIVFLKLAGQQS